MIDSIKDVAHYTQLNINRLQDSVNHLGLTVSLEMGSKSSGRSSKVWIYQGNKVVDNILLGENTKRDTLEKLYSITLDTESLAFKAYNITLKKEGLTSSQLPFSWFLRMNKEA